MKISLALVRVVALGLLLTETGCNQMKATKLPIPAARSVAVTETPLVRSQVVSTGQKVSDFGWLPNGQIYYSTQHGDLSNWPYISVEEITTLWFAYDPVTKATTEIQSPYPSISAETRRIIDKDGSLKLISMEPSPSGKVLLYASIAGRDAPVHDQVPLIKLYAARQQGRERMQLSDDFYQVCGIPNSQSQWSEDEMLVAGSCEVLQGVPGYFLADLANNKVQMLFYETENGDQIFPTSIALAHRTPLLAIESGFLWVTPANISEDWGPIKLDQSSLVVKDSVSSPLWSADDQWVYYWRWGPLASSYDEITGRKLYPWHLERINLATHHSEVVLSEDDLRQVLGDDLYEMNMDYGINIHWRLSKDGMQILFYDTKPALFLIYLQ